jgi:hypothetical protein
MPSPAGGMPWRVVGGFFGMRCGLACWIFVGRVAISACTALRYAFAFLEICLKGFRLKAEIPNPSGILLTGIMEGHSRIYLAHSSRIFPAAIGHTSQAVNFHFLPAFWSFPISQRAGAGKGFDMHLPVM